MIKMTGRLFMTAEQIVAFGRLTEAANRGDGSAACRLGDMYREGVGGLRYSPKQTFRWYSRSALAGDVNGQNNLGACYEHGLGCGQSYVKAVKWYRLAAARQHGTASMNLGYCHFHGQGVPADKGEALRLFRLAVEQGEDKARQEVERLDGPMKGPRVRFVDRTVPDRNLGIVGVAGLTPSASSEANSASGKRRWTAEDQYRADLGAWEKDDCFDLPDPESDYGKRMKAEAEEAIERLIREGGAPRLPDRPLS